MCGYYLCPIYKKNGSQNDPNNHRGVTLLSSLSKRFTSCINRRLIIENITLTETQAAFRTKYSTTDIIFTLHTLIELYMNRHIYCAFIDNAKAFDMISRVDLWRKLLNTCLNGKNSYVIKNIYSSAKSCIKNNREFSKLFCCEMGLRQGENLSPLFFALFVDDFDSYISNYYKGFDVAELYDIEFMNYVFPSLCR